MYIMYVCMHVCILLMYIYIYIYIYTIPHYRWAGPGCTGAAGVSHKRDNVPDDIPVLVMNNVGETSVTIHINANLNRTLTTSASRISSMYTPSPSKNNTAIIADDGDGNNDDDDYGDDVEPIQEFQVYTSEEIPIKLRVLFYSGMNDVHVEDTDTAYIDNPEVRQHKIHTYFRIC